MAALGHGIAILACILGAGLALIAIVGSQQVVAAVAGKLDRIDQGYSSRADRALIAIAGAVALLVGGGLLYAVRSWS